MISSSLSFYINNIERESNAPFGRNMTRKKCGIHHALDHIQSPRRTFKQARFMIECSHNIHVGKSIIVKNQRVILEVCHQVGLKQNSIDSKQVQNGKDSGTVACIQLFRILEMR